MNFNILNLWASFVLCLFLSFNSYAQLPKGIIADPATGSGRVVLDPNLDGWITTTGAAFINQDSSESEIPYKKMVIISEPNSDLGAGPNCGYTDFVYSTTYGMTMAGGYYVDDNNNWLIRLRLSRFLPNSKSYSLMIDTDLKMGSSGINKDPGYVNGNPGFEIEVLLSTANPGGLYIYDVNNTATPVQKVNYSGHTNYQRSVAKSNECGDEDAFLDFFIPFGQLTTYFGITTSTPLRWVLTDNMSADESTIGHLSNISDLWGSSKYTETGILENIENFTPTCATCTPGKLRSVCPAINSPISNGATSISGTGTNGDTIKLYRKNGTATRIPNSSTSTIVSGGVWTISGLSSIATGDSIGATATTPGKGESINNCNVAIVKSCGVIPAISLTGMVCSTKGICYSGGAAIPGASITVYYNGSLVSPYAPSTVDGSGNFGWDCVAGGCGSGGAGCLNGNSSVQVFQTVGGCVSQPLCMNVVNGGSPGAATAGTFTTAPTITTNPLIDGTSPITGTCVSGALVTLFADGTQIGSVTGSTSWSITPSPTLITGVVLSAYSKTTALCTSVASASVTVARLSNPPVVNSAGCGTVTTVSGTSAESSGSKIILYDNGSLKDSTTVTSSGTWSKTLSSGSYTGPITAKCRISGGTLSSASNSVTILSRTTDASLSITTTPITDALTSISGNGTSANTVKLYVDGMQIGTTATVSGGTWTVSSLVAGKDLFQGGVITATSTTSGNCASNPTSNVSITCVNPADLGVTSSVSTCQGSVATGIVINNSEVGTVYQLYNSTTPFGEAVLGTGGTIGLISETMSTSATLSVKAIKSSSCATTFSQAITVTINPPDSCWYGRVSTDWFDARNWCLSGNIPTATTKTKILGSAAFMPIIDRSGAVCDTMIINSGATVTTSGSQNLDVYGGWNNSGTFTANSGTVSFKDNNGQLIKGSSVTSFNNLTINNTSAAGITLQQDANVTAVLTLTDGIVNTTSTNLLSLTSTASSTGGSTASFVDGPMDKTGNTAFIFPVGDGTLYAPIAIGTPNASSTYKAQYFETAFSNITTMASAPTPILAYVSLTEYWELNRTSGSGTATVNLYWNNTLNDSRVGNCTDLRVAYWDGTEWENNNNTNTTTGGCPSSGNITTTSDVTTYGTFTFGSTGAPLPVKLISFSATCDDKDVLVNWATSSELNNDYFTIERGLSETEFKAIGTVKGYGNSSQLLNYQFVDREAMKSNLPGTTWFYKLKQTDYNGMFEYSNSIAADNCNTKPKAVLLYPNVTNGKVQVINNSDQVATIEIYNSMGASVYTSQISNANAELSLNLPVGMYYYVLKNKDEWFGKGKLMLK